MFGVQSTFLAIIWASSLSLDYSITRVSSTGLVKIAFMLSAPLLSLGAEAMLLLLLLALRPLNHGTGRQLRCLLPFDVANVSAENADKFLPPFLSW